MARRRSPVPIRNELSIANKDGRVVQGWYRVEGGTLTVSTGSDSKSAPLRGSPPEPLARALLRDLVQD
jgi:hypothetical protein